MPDRFLTFDRVFQLGAPTPIEKGSTVTIQFLGVKGTTDPEMVRQFCEHAPMVLDALGRLWALYTNGPGPEGCEETEAEVRKVVMEALYFDPDEPEED